MMDARISVALPSHPKTKKLIKKVGTDAAWRLVCLFLWAAQNRSDGVLSGMTAEDIELAVDWTGEDGEFVSALVAVGFVDGSDDDGYIIHDWVEHNPWAAGSKDRSEKAAFNALSKHHGKEEAARRMPEYAAKIGFACSNDEPSKESADNNPASSMHAAETSTAPSLSPSPSLNTTPPIAPQGGQSIGKDACASENHPTAKQKSQAKTFAKWIDEVRANGEKAVSDYAPVWKYADDLKLPRGFVEIAWVVFRDRFSGEEKAQRKRYTDWRKTFLNYVRNNYLKLWFWSERDNQWMLTTAGVQADRAAEVAA